MTALYFASLAEQRAVAWYKRSCSRRFGGFAIQACQDVAYDPFHAGTDWRKPHNGIPRATWVHWRVRPYGAVDFNQMHQLAQICIRRNVHFPDMAKKMGRRKWSDPVFDSIRRFRKDTAREAAS